MGERCGAGKRIGSSAVFLRSPVPLVPLFVFRRFQAARGVTCNVEAQVPLDVVFVARIKREGCRAVRQTHREKRA